MVKVNFIGRVMDQASTPIFNAKVTLDFTGCTPFVVHTDGEGIYRFPVNFDGTDKVDGKISVSADDYKPTCRLVDLYPTSSSSLQEFRLKSDAKKQENRISIQVALIGAAAVIIAALIGALPRLQKIFTPEAKEKKVSDSSLQTAMPTASAQTPSQIAPSTFSPLPTSSPSLPITNKSESLPIADPLPRAKVVPIPQPLPIAKGVTKNLKVDEPDRNYNFVSNPNELNPDFSWNPGTSDSNYKRVSDRVFKITTGGNTDLYEMQNSAPTLNYPVSRDFEAEVKVKFSSKISYQRAGIGVRPLDNPSYFTRIHLLENGRIELAQNRFGYGEEKVSTQDFIKTYDSDTVYFRVRKQGSTFSAYYSPDKVDWVLAGSYSQLKIPNEAQIFLYVLSAHNPNPATAEFSDFQLKWL